MKIKGFLKRLGPGFITGAADDDPSGIATYSQSGSQFGYTQLWAVLFSFPFMTVIQEICGRIGMVTGKGLGSVIREKFSKKILFGAIFLLFLANTINIGADLGAMASSAQLVFGLPFGIWLMGMTVLILTLEIFVSYKTYSKFLKYLGLSLLAYVVTAFVVKQNWHEVALATFLPKVVFSKSYLLNIVAFLGTTISPYLFFWQASEEVEEEVEHHKLKSMEDGGVPRLGKKDIRNMRIDTTIGMLFSNVVTFFIILTTAATLFKMGITNVDTADKAAFALRPIAGDFAYLLFALGIVGVGLMAVPVLAGSASYAFAETFKWKEGLYRKFSKAHGFYGVITIATLIGLMVNFTSIPPFTFLYYSAALNGVLAPPLMILIMLVANDRRIMGEHKNGIVSNFLGWLITGIMGVVAIALIWSLF